MLLNRVRPMRVNDRPTFVRTKYVEMKRVMTTRGGSSQKETCSERGLLHAADGYGSKGRGNLGGAMGQLGEHMNRFDGSMRGLKKMGHLGKTVKNRFDGSMRGLKKTAAMAPEDGEAAEHEEACRGDRREDR